jgi:hypothetical protein
MCCLFVVPDTAAVYRNEEAIGLALQTLLPKFSLSREDIFLTTKLGNVHCCTLFCVPVLCVSIVAHCFVCQSCVFPLLHIVLCASPVCFHCSTLFCVPVLCVSIVPHCTHCNSAVYRYGTPMASICAVLSDSSQTGHKVTLYKLFTSWRMCGVI